MVMWSWRRRRGWTLFTLNPRVFSHLSGWQQGTCRRPSRRVTSFHRGRNQLKSMGEFTMTRWSNSRVTGIHGVEDTHSAGGRLELRMLYWNAIGCCTYSHNLNTVLL